MSCQRNRAAQLVSLVAIPSTSTTSLQDFSEPSKKNLVILKTEKLILDEKSGKYRPTLDPENNISTGIVTSNSNYHLDEQTGNFNQDCSLPEDLSPSDFSNLDSESDYNPGLDMNDSSTSDSEITGVILDEFNGVIKRKRARKGQGNTRNWTRNIVKRRRQEGKEYTSIKRKKDLGVVGKEIRKERQLKPRCESTKCEKSVNKMCNNVSELTRCEIFQSFWNNLTWDERKSYVNTMVVQKSVTTQSKGVPSRRENTFDYFLRIDGEMKPVCKRMFLSTLGLGEWTVLNWVKKSNNSIGMIKKTVNVRRVKSINEAKINHITFFLDSIPRVPSHYCRQNTSKMYVDINYRSWMDLYVSFEEYCFNNNIPSNEKATYKCFINLVHDKNLSIYKPKKDQCDLCYGYKNKNIEEADYEVHIIAKERARKEKDLDKKKCENGKIHMITVDLQAVQTIPAITAGAQYFKLKLCVHQFTIYNEKDGSVTCYVWHEGEGGMDANIFTSCLIDYFKNIDDKSKPIVVFSDGCNTQNRNVTLANALQHFAINNNVEIHQKYLVVGHTQMECDSVHACIERKMKNKELYVPADFNTIIKEARSKQPYTVKYLDHDFFSNFSSLNYYKSIRPGSKVGDPCVVDIRALKYNNSGLSYKLNFDDEWLILPQRMNRNNSASVVKLYSAALPISKRKYNDLQSLKNLIPKDYHGFYDSLLYV